MALGPRLDLRQSQSLVMTPQLQQAIRLLALSNLELEGYIAGELEKNPLLETGAPDAPAAGNEPDLPEVAAIQPDADSAADMQIEGGMGLTDSPLDADYSADTFIDDGPGDRMADLRAGSGLGSGAGEYASSGFEEAPDFDSFSAPAPGLHDHLMDQAGAHFSGRDLMIAEQIIGQIDANGYFDGDLLQLAYNIGVPLNDVEAILAVIQTFDPTGVGARNLAECLALQAKEADRYDPCMQVLIANLDILARGALPQLKRICGVDDEDLADMIRELREYDPKPGLRFASDDSPAIVPDLLIQPSKTGWSIEINSATLPRLLVNRRYYTELSSGPQDKNSKAWLNDCLMSANWLVKALDQRQKTIIKVATELVKQQEDFFRKGVEHLRPLTLRTIADAIEIGRAHV